YRPWTDSQGITALGLDRGVSWITGNLEGHFWRIEQTLYALCSSRFGVELLPERYDIRLSEGINNSSCRHYVGAIRHLFYGEGIRHLVKGRFLKNADHRQASR